MESRSVPTDLKRKLGAQLRLYEQKKKGIKTHSVDKIVECDRFCL